LAWWPASHLSSSFSVNPSQLQILFSQGNPQETHIPSDWRPVSPPELKQHTLTREEGLAH
jgi:hypothetical protein